ncbi:MAG: hypothetical protein KDC34_01505 [Saprospiraceae bacterium]|nr:hypothetical protein [Saprospiraceae bacterium]
MFQVFPDSTSQILRTLFRFSILIALVSTNACTNDKGKDIPDVSHINMNVEIQRFDQDLISIDTNDFSPGLRLLESKYPAFSEIYFGQILGSTDPRIAEEGHDAYVRGFVANAGIRKLYDTCQVVYPDMTDLEADFNQAFRYFNYYFPEAPIPTLTTFISEFTIANFIYGQNDLAIGLEFYLGENFPYAYYNPGNANFSQYLTRANNREHMVSKTLMPLIEDLVGPVPENRLIDYMIQNGKKRYLLEQLVPFAADTVLMEYSPDQLQWCRDNEQEVWAYLLDEELLYSTRYQDFRKLVEYSPSGTSLMPPESPGRVGNYIGLQIIKSFMRRFPETTLEELILMDDSQKILDLSKYKPRR